MKSIPAGLPSVLTDTNNNLYNNTFEIQNSTISQITSMESIYNELSLSSFSSSSSLESASYIDNNITTMEHLLNTTTSTLINNLTNSDCDEFETAEFQLVAKVVLILTPILFGTIAITGFFGNSLVILVVLLNSHMHSTTNLLIVNLASADLLFVIFCIPFTAFDYLVYRWPFGIAWCKIVQYLIVVTALASIYTLVLMSIDRFLAIVYPVRSRSIRTEFLTKIAITILWITILIVSSPVLLLHNLSSYKDCNNNTYIYCTYDLDVILDHTTYSIIFLITTYIFPLILISVLYIKIVSRIWRKIGGKMSAESQKGRRRVTRIVVVVVLAFASLWLPVQTLLVLKAFNIIHGGLAVNIIIQVAAQTIAYTSSCINPILYAFLSENFRKAFRKAIYFSSSYRFGPSKQYNDLSTTSTAAAAAAVRRRISAVQDSMAVI